MTFLILGLLSLSALALLGAIFFLYRFLMRSHLFPQLPRVWRVEKVRFFLCAAVFVVCFAAFLLLGWLNNQAEPNEDSVIYQTQPTQNQPSFDGTPASASSNQERVLPPQDATPSSQAQPPIGVISSSASAQTTTPEKPLDQPAKPEAIAPESTKPAPAKPEAIAPEPTKPAPAKPSPAPAKPPTKPAVAPASETTPAAGDENKPPLPQPKPYVPGPAELAAKPDATAKPESTASAAPTPTPAPQSAKFSICVASYASQAGAQSEMNNFKGLGQAHIVPTDIPGKGRWYRLCIGYYDSQAQAQKLALQWRNSGAAKGAFVVSLP